MERNNLLPHIMAPSIRGLKRPITNVGVLFGAFALSAYFALQLRPGGPWRGVQVARALGRPGPSEAKPDYDLTRLDAVTATLQAIRDKYVDPSRVHPRDMLLSALDFVQRDVAQVIVQRDPSNQQVTVRVGPNQKTFSVADVHGLWDVLTHLREVFAFLQGNLKNSPDVKLPEVEYAACNGILYTLDPHSNFLSPEDFKEMTIATQGAFGGVGIVISTRDQQLTVMKPMDGTPAGRAGLKRYDRITAINNESTLNMPLEDAVRLLRGQPGSDVTVQVHRDGPGGWAGSRPFVLRREVIQVDSVQSRMLADDVGYVRIKQFQAGTAAELDRALASLQHADPKIRGLVLDLRSNPGGLLDQAAKVVDRFVRHGVIVSTVSSSEPREEIDAKDAGNEPNWPMVVLVNPSSASASEIVAGALKNLNRAVIVGQTTFGKGSVQVLFPDVTREKAALKLTVAQYLTPGDVSIQSVGIAPDIELEPMTVDPLEMDLLQAGKRFRERDLSKHLSNALARAGQKPLDVVRYDLSEPQRETLRERGEEVDDKFEMDFPIQFARDLAARLTPGVPRAQAVSGASEYIQRVSSQEMSKAAADLHKLSIDWSAPPSVGTPAPAPSDFEVKVDTDRPNNEVPAGGSMNLRVTVKNKGHHTAYQLRATTKSDNPYYDGKELVFGEIGPGQSKTAVAPLGWCDFEGHKIGSTAAEPSDAKRVCTIPKDSPSRSDGITVNFETPFGSPPASAEVRPVVDQLPRPEFAYSYQMIDNGQGDNGDGRIQRGEHVTMYLTVKNIGKGRSYDTQANVRNLSGDGVLLQAGRFDISNMNPGDTRSVAFKWTVRPDFHEPDVGLELTVGDRDLGEFSTEKLEFPVEAAADVVRDEGVSKVSAKVAPMYETVESSAASFGVLPRGTVVRRLGREGDLVKIDLGQQRFAFVKGSTLVNDPGATPADTTSFDTTFEHAPPLVELTANALATRAADVQVTATIGDKTGIMDAYAFAGASKVFYRSNQGAADPKALQTTFDVPLRPGVNIVTVVARHSPETTTRRTIVIRRDGPSGELLATPTGEDSNLLSGSPGDGAHGP